MYIELTFGICFNTSMMNYGQAQTDTGWTSMKPISWDYRFSNLCNFKCRTCGDMLSSSWETEQKKHNMTNFDNPKNNWMIPEVRKQIT